MKAHNRMERTIAHEDVPQPGQGLPVRADSLVCSEYEHTQVEDTQSRPCDGEVCVTW